MRRLAGKCVALFLALLMLLTSMPLTTLAESVTSEPWGFDVRPLVEEGGSPTNAGSPSALDVVKEAAAKRHLRRFRRTVLCARADAAADQNGR